MDLALVCARLMTLPQKWVHVSLKIYFKDPSSKFQKLEFGYDTYTYIYFI